MRVVGNAEYGLIFYRDKLPKFRNEGKMIFNVIDWEKDTVSPKLHPTQKPVPLLEKLIKIFTDEGDVVIDPCAGSGSTIVAAENLNRKAYGFEIIRDIHAKATAWIEENRIRQKEIRELGYAKTELEKINPLLF